MVVRVVLSVVVVCVCLCVVVCSAAPFIPYSYPLFLQCDAAWGKDKMGGDATVCQQGCAMSCVSMFVNGRNFTLPTGQSSNPGSLNAWLKANQGYKCIAGNCNNLVLDAPNRLAPPGHITFVSETEKPEDPLQVLQGLHQGMVYIAHVRNRSHFVLVLGMDPENPSTLLVNDPYYKTDSYPYAEVSDFIIYQVAGP